MAIVKDETGSIKSEKDYFMASEDESQRLSNQHKVIKDAMPCGNLVCAPINLSSGHLRVLDSGTADGKRKHSHDHIQCV